MIEEQDGHLETEAAVFFVSAQAEPQEPRWSSRKRR